MKSLSLTEDQAEEVMKKQSASQEQETFGKLLQRIENHSAYSFIKKVMEDSYFFSMPLKLKKNSERYCIHILDVIDHASALNQAWEAEINPESLIVVITIMTIGDVGFECEPEYEKVATNATLRSPSNFKWAKNPNYSSLTARNRVLQSIVKNKVELSNLEFDAITYLSGHEDTKNKLSIIVKSSFEYVRETMIL